MSVETQTPLETEIETKPTEDIHPVGRAFLFLGKSKVRRNFIWIPLVGLLICAILGVFNPQKHPLPYEEYIPGSWAIFGILIFSLAALSANTLFRMFGRAEDYYGEGGLPDPAVSTDPSVTGELQND